MKKNLTLTGMMGVGKSTIGKFIGQKLSMEFIDIDRVIEQKLKTTIQGIFKRKGEIFFREYEEKITLEQIKKDNVVISLGGGAFMNSNIRQKILKKCVSFWLHLDTHLLKKRLINSKKRPLLNNEDLKSVLEKIYNEREEIYALADYKIDCKQLSIQSTANKIIKLYADN